jgi:hypothetical protein
VPAHLAGVTSVESNNSPVNPRSATEWWTPRLAGPVIAAALLRLALLAITLVRNGSGVLSQGDTSSYLIPGRNLLLHGRFVADGAPDLLRTPGYSLFLAATSLAGLPAAALANLILSVFSVVLVWRLGRTAFGDNRIALGAAWIFAFEPLSVDLSIALLSETLFLVFFLLCLERLSAFLQGRRLPVLATAGVWLAAATFVRPITYYLPVALAVGLFVSLARVPGLRWKAPAVLLISVLPWLAAWQIRNWVETGYSGFSSAGDESLYSFILPSVISAAEHRNYMAVREGLGTIDFDNNSGQEYLFQPYLALHPEQAAWSQGQRLAYMRSEALRGIRAHYGVYLRLCFRAMLSQVFYPGGYVDNRLHLIDSAHTAGSADEDAVRSRIMIIEEHPWAAISKLVFTCMLLGMYLFAVLGVFRTKMHNACLWLLLGTSLYLMALAGTIGQSGGGYRYRHPVMPVVCILAAAGFMRKNRSLNTQS